MLLRDGRPELVYGTMGGEGQPQTQAALVTRMIDFGMTPQEAIDAPRWLYGRTWGADSNDLRLEGRIPDEVVCGLARRGHPVKKVEDYTDVMGHAGAILVNQETGGRSRLRLLAGAGSAPECFYPAEGSGQIVIAQDRVLHPELRGEQGVEFAVQGFGYVAGEDVFVRGISVPHAADSVHDRAAARVLHFYDAVEIARVQPL